jgi:hypothetical protein
MNDNKSSSFAPVLVVVLFLLALPCLAGVVLLGGLLFWDVSPKAPVITAPTVQPSPTVQQGPPPVPPPATPNPAPTH